jgi:hypothetical protein
MPQFADHGKQYLIQNTAPELSVLRLYVEKMVSNSAQETRV